MDKQKNILLAKKYMVESIYRSANIEGVGVTFPETQTICDGMSVAKMPGDGSLKMLIVSLIQKPFVH